MDIEEKPKRHKRFRIGALILAIVIIIILFKVDLRKDMESPRFKSNIAYIEEMVGNFFQKRIKKPMLSAWDNMFKLKTPNIDNSTIDRKIQPNKIKNYFNITSEEEINQFSSPVAN